MFQTTVHQGTISFVSFCLRWFVFTRFTKWISTSSGIWKRWCSLWSDFSIDLKNLGNISLRQSLSVGSCEQTKASPYDNPGKIMRIARICTLSISSVRYWVRPECHAAHAYSNTGRILVVYMSTSNLCIVNICYPCLDALLSSLQTQSFIMLRQDNSCIPFVRFDICYHYIVPGKIV